MLTKNYQIFLNALASSKSRTSVTRPDGETVGLFPIVVTETDLLKTNTYVDWNFYGESQVAAKNSVPSYASNVGFNSDGTASTSTSAPYLNLMYAKIPTSASGTGTSYSFFSLLVGTGTAPATVNDYKLANQIELQSTLTACSRTFDNSNNTLKISREFKNVTENDVTITELGCYLIYNYATYISKYGTRPLLIARKVLSTPVTIPVGKSATFNYYINLNNMLDNQTS